MKAAELIAAFSIVGCAAGSGIAGAMNNARWSAVLFVALGLAIGLLVARFVYSLGARLLLSTPAERASAASRPVLLMYTVGSMMACCAGVGIAAGLAWLIARYVL